MRLASCVAVLAAIGAGVGAVSGDASAAAAAELVKRANTVFESEGATYGVLSLFDTTIRLLEATGETALLPPLLLKKSLIEVNLEKYASAIDDLNKCLKYDPSMATAKSALVKIYVEMGRFEDARAFNDPATDARINDLTRNMDECRKLLMEGKYTECVQMMDQLVMPYSELNKDAWEDHYTCSVGNYQSDSYFSDITHDIKQIIKNTPSIASMKWYPLLSSYFLYGNVQFTAAAKYIKSCMRIDFEYGPCGKLSKQYSRLGSVFQLLEDYGILQEFVYDFTGDFPTDIKQDYNWSEIYALLFEPSQKIRQAKGNNNYEFLKNEFESFVNTQKADPTKYKFSKYLNRMACEASVRLGDTKSSHCKLIPKEDQFFPKYVAAIDKLIQRGKFQEAREKLELFPKNVKATNIFKERWMPVEQHLKQEEQRRFQQQRFQQQQQQQQHQQRQQQQQQHQRARESGKDYYKILGIDKDADDATIKKAYRALTFKYHPDRYKGGDMTPEQIEEKMQDINIAYEVLSDKQERAAYDKEASGHHGGGGGGAHFGGGGHNGGGFNGFGQDFMKQFMQNAGGGGGGFQFNFGGFGQ